MKLTSLRVTNFRNLQDRTFDFQDGFNFIIAPNGSGKTNLIESIYMLSNGKSFRTHNEIEILPLSQDKDFFRISGSINLKGTDKSLEYIFKSAPHAFRKSQKFFKINEKPKRLKDFVGTLASISFFPTSVDIISGSPLVRRNDLDASLCQLDETYLVNLEAYKKVVRNRNKIIDRILQGMSARSELTYWTEQLVQLGSKVISSRLEFFRENGSYLNELAESLYSHDLKSLKVVYVSKFIDSQDTKLNDIIAKFQNKITESSNKEIYAGKTLYGPHLEDFLFFLDDKNLKLFGSRGQQRLAAFIYRMAIGKMISAKKGHNPILLLDDLFSELDAKHISNVLKFLKNLNTQLILTATKADYIKQLKLKDINSITL